MTRVLFVDDDAMVLRGLERGLRVQRLGWDCVFLDDPLIALAKLDDLRPDAVVSDMLMPGLDGAAFLTEAASRSPSMARFVLSGEVGAGSLVRMAAAAHQCLAKPCRAEVLADVIRRTVAEPAAAAASPLRDGLYGLSSLPVSACQVERLMRALQGAGSDAQDTKAMAVLDGAVGLATKLMQVAGWMGLGVDTPPLDPHDAYWRLGPDAIRELIASGLVSPVKAWEETALQRALWHRAATTAAVTRAIATDEGLESEAVQRAALVASWRATAPLVLDAVCPKEHAEISRGARLGTPERAALERQAFGVTGHEALAMLLRLWGLPSALIEMVRHTAEPLAFAEDSVVATVAAAEAVVALLDGGDIPTATRHRLERTRHLDRIEKWRAIAVDVAA